MIISLISIALFVTYLVLYHAHHVQLSIMCLVCKATQVSNNLVRQTIKQKLVFTLWSHYMHEWWTIHNWTPHSWYTCRLLLVLVTPSTCTCQSLLCSFRLFGKLRLFLSYLNTAFRVSDMHISYIVYSSCILYTIVPAEMAIRLPSSPLDTNQGSSGGQPAPSS